LGCFDIILKIVPLHQISEAMVRVEIIFLYPKKMKMLLGPDLQLANMVGLYYFSLTQTQFHK